MYGSQQQFSRSVMTLNCVAELRYAKETAEFFDGTSSGSGQTNYCSALRYRKVMRRGSASWIPV
jgi:hypothetical protein